MPVPRNSSKPQSLSAQPKSQSQQQQEQRMAQQNFQQQQQVASTAAPIPQQPRKSEHQVEMEWRQVKEKFELAVKEYHEVVQIKMLEQNKTSKDKDRERYAIDGLYKTATALDEVNLGEGSTALATISLGELLFLRSRVNELEYQQMLMLKELRALQKELGVKSDG